MILPRFVIAKKGKKGVTFYWNPPVYWKRRAEAEKRPYPFESQPLGTNLGQAEVFAAAHPHNARFDEWRQGGVASPERRYAAHGTVEWLFEQYMASDIFKRRVGERSRKDYAQIFKAVADLPTKSGGRFGQLPISSVTPAAAEKVYARMVAGEKYRRGEKTVMYCKTVWRLMQPHHPREFPKDVPNPWIGVQLYKRVKCVKAAVDREAVYTFAWAAVEAERPEAAAAAVICFEWLQRPENVMGGYIRWTDYQPGQTLRIEHHKTGAMIMHPLSDGGDRFYPEAEEILALLPKRGVSMIIGPEGQQYTQTRFAQIVRRIADKAGLPKTFTLDACRHGGMTELEEAGLTDGQGRALSAHRSRAYERYAKRTKERMVGATRARHSHRVGTK